MNKHFHKIAGTIILILVVFVATMHQTHAAGLFDIKLGLFDAFNMFVALIFNTGLKVMSLLVALAGALLNLSIKLTLNIKAFVDNAPAIFTTWKAIRDISGIFIIFYLLYDGIQLILGLKSPKWGDSVKNVIMAGVLINFSFFFASLGIDASNMVSMQIYNAIAPANSLSNQSQLGLSKLGVESFWTDGGLSDIFMNSLEIPRLFDTTGAQSTNLQNQSSALGSGEGITGQFNDFFKIVGAGLIGMYVEFIAAISFAAAGLAFIGRFAVLIFLLAFSPIYFLSLLAPEVAEYTKKWTSAYRAMLLFMPVYLLLMYLALNVLTTTPMFKGPSSTTIQATAGSTASPVTGSIIENAYAQQAAAGGSNSDVYTQWFAIAINATIVIVLINLPLAAAASIASKASKSFDITKPANWMRSQLASRTVGRAAYAAGQSRAVAKLASVTPLGGSLVSAGLSKVSKNDFGVKKGNYEDRLKAKSKAREDLHKQIGTVDRSSFSDDAKGQAEYEQVAKGREDLQQKYREKLPWKNTILATVLDNRANTQSALSLNDTATLKGNKKQVEANTARANEIYNKQIDSLRERIRQIRPNSNSPINPTDRATLDRLEEQIVTIKKSQDEGVDKNETELTRTRLFSTEEINDLKILQQSNAEIQPRIDRANKKKQKDDFSGFVKAVTEEGAAGAPPATPPSAPPATGTT